MPRATGRAEAERERGRRRRGRVGSKAAPRAGSTGPSEASPRCGHEVGPAVPRLPGPRLGEPEPDSVTGGGLGERGRARRRDCRRGYPLDCSR